MILNDEQKKILIEKLKNIKNATCLSCGANEWTISPKVFELREFNNGNLVIGGQNSSIIPVIEVTCKNCGRIVLYNALVMGIIKPNETKK